MAYEIELPHVGESVTEAVIGKWLKAVGDHVQKYDPLVEVVTDKVNMEVPAPDTGRLTRIVAEEGETVEMGAVIAEMELERAEHKAVDEARTRPAPDTSRPNRIGTIISDANVGPTGGVFADSSLAEAVRRTTSAPQQAPAPTGPAGNRYSPVVLRLAEQHGIDLRTVSGTGIGGRITKRDVLSAAEAAAAAPAAPASAGSDGQDRIVKPSPIRRTIASHMSRSASEIPHAWTAMEADVTGLVACRGHRRQAFRDRHGVDLTYLPFTLSAVAAALRANPIVNSSWVDGEIHVKGHINIGIAVAAPDGLVVPTLHDADRDSVGSLALRVAPLVERARAGRLTLDDVQGGTFTLNNTGALGSVWGGAIINSPQAGILTTEAIVKRPVVISVPTGEAIAIRSMMNICFSFDHRVLDGAEAAAFVREVKVRLESFTAGASLEHAP